MYTDCTVSHNYTGVITLIKRSTTILQQLIQQRTVVESDTSTDGSDSDNDIADSTNKGLSMSEYSAQQTGGSTAVDEDGWTTVSKGKK